MKDLTEEEIFRLNFEIWIKGSQVKSVGGGAGWRAEGTYATYTKQKKDVYTKC